MQLKLAMPYIKNKLFEIAKELNEFKFQKNLKIEFLKEEKVLNQIFVDPWLDSYKQVFDDVTIDKLLDKHDTDLFAAIYNLTHEGLSWSLQPILRH